MADQFNWETPEKRRAAARKQLLSPAQLLAHAQASIDPQAVSASALGYGKRALTAMGNVPQFSPIKKAANIATDVAGAIPDIWSGMKEQAQLSAQTGAPVLPAVNIPLPAAPEAIAAPSNQGAIPMPQGFQQPNMPIPPRPSSSGGAIPAVSRPDSIYGDSLVYAGPGHAGRIAKELGQEQNQVGAYGAVRIGGGEGGIVPGVPTIPRQVSSMRRGADTSAIKNSRTITNNEHTNMPNHGAPGMIGGQRVGDARPMIGGDADTEAHRARVMAAGEFYSPEGALTPQLPGQVPVEALTAAVTPTVMPPAAAADAFNAQSSIGGQPPGTIIGKGTPNAMVDPSGILNAPAPVAAVPDAATAWSASNGGSRVPLAGGAISQDQLNSLGLALNPNKDRVPGAPVASGGGAVPGAGGRELTYEDALARGFDLAGSADGWASAIVRGNQARGFAAGQLKSNQANRTAENAENRTALDLSKFGLEQEKFAAGAEGREADVAYKDAMTTAKKIENDIFNSMSADEKKQYKMGGKSKKALLDKYHHDEASKEAARRTANNLEGDPSYDEIYNEVLSGFKNAQAHIDAGEKYVVTQEGKAAVDEPWYNLFANDQAAIPRIAGWQKQ